MAQPITFDATHVKASRHAGGQPESAAYADAIHSACELLKLMDERGILDLLRGLVGGGDAVVNTVAKALDSPEVIRGLRNFLLLTSFFATIPPEILGSLVEAAVEGAKTEKSRKAPGLLTLGRRLLGADVRHALSVMLDLAENAGRAL